MPLGAGVLRRLAGFGVVVVCAISHAGALAAWADTLPGALIQAYVCNPQLNSQRAVVRATDEGVPQALSGYKPRVTATGSVGQQYTTGVSKTAFSAEPRSAPPRRWSARRTIPASAPAIRRARSA